MTDCAGPTRLLRRSKGWGKDPFAAAIALCEWIGPCRLAGRDRNGDAVAAPHPSSLVMIGAVALPQTRNTADVIRAILPRRTIEAYGIEPGTQRWHCGKQATGGRAHVAQGDGGPAG